MYYFISFNSLRSDFAGRIDIDFDNEPLSRSSEKQVYLADIWPTRQEVQETELRLGTFEQSQTLNIQIILKLKIAVALFRENYLFVLH